MKKEFISIAIGGLVVGFVLGLMLPKMFSSKDAQHDHEQHAAAPPPPAEQAPARFSNDQLEHVIKEYELILEKDPKNIEAYFQIGNIYYEMRKVNKAIESYSKGLELNPSSIDLLTQLGNLYFDTEKYQLAVDNYQKVLDIEPNINDVRVDMAIMYRRLNKPDIAIKELKTAIENDPEHTNAYVNLGIILRFDKKEYQKAIDAWQTFLDKFPDHVQAGKIKELIKKTKELI